MKTQELDLDLLDSNLYTYQDYPLEIQTKSLKNNKSIQHPILIPFKVQSIDKNSFNQSKESHRYNNKDNNNNIINSNLKTEEEEDNNIDRVIPLTPSKLKKNYLQTKSILPKINFIRKESKHIQLKSE